MNTKAIKINSPILTLNIFKLSNITQQKLYILRQKFKMLSQSPFDNVLRNRMKIVRFMSLFTRSFLGSVNTANDLQR